MFKSVIYFISTIHIHTQLCLDLSIFPLQINLLNVDGYSMRDIRYKWNEGPNSVGVSEDVSLPQFKVLGYRQRAMEISLTTGRFTSLLSDFRIYFSQKKYKIKQGSNPFFNFLVLFTHRILSFKKSINYSKKSQQNFNVRHKFFDFFILLG